MFGSRPVASHTTVTKIEALYTYFRAIAIRVNLNNISLNPDAQLSLRSENKNFKEVCKAPRYTEQSESVQSTRTHLSRTS